MPGERMPVYNHGFRKKRTRALIGGNRAFYIDLSRSGDFVTKALKPLKKMTHSVSDSF